MRDLALGCLCLLSVLVLAWALPALYDMVLLKPIDKTHIFYSPVLKKCIYTEQIRGHDQQAEEKSEGHHADIVYKDESGVYYDRLAFEAALPFIYFRNMEMRGLLPLHLEGKVLDRPAIERARRVLELPARHLDGKLHQHGCLPLLESAPGQVALLYPTDRFRMTSDAMDFTDADSNAHQAGLSQTFSQALHQVGFAFPARHVGGNFTTFKPYEGGIFLVDSRGGLFHLIRRHGKAVVSKIALPDGVVPRHVLVSESKERLWLGLVVDEKDRIWLIREQDMALLGLDVPAYDPDVMDCKLIFDPLHLTIVVSDTATVHTDVFVLPPPDSPHGKIHKPFHSFSHPMSRAMESWEGRIADVLFPFRLDLDREDSALLYPELKVSPRWLYDALLFSLALAGLYAIFLQKTTSGLHHPRQWIQVAFVAVTGIYGLIPLLILGEKA